MPLVSLVLSLLGKKTLAGIVGVVALSSSYYYTYDKGYDAAKLDVKGEYQEALEVRITALTEQYNEGVVLEQHKAKIAQRALQELRDTPKQIEVQEIVKIVEDSDCKSLSSDYVGLLNQHQGEDPFKSKD